MSSQLRQPTDRVCERCDREEQWDDEVDAWQIAREDGQRLAGNPHCIHEWDINGAFNPFDGN